MKHLSLLLTVLILGALPLVAAALDYGPDRPLLAAEGGAPQLPSADARAAPMDAMPKSDAEVDNGEVPDAGPAMPRSAPTPMPTTVPAPVSAPSASNQPRIKATAPAAAPGPASWQSLLPGSIQ